MDRICIVTSSSYTGKLRQLGVVQDIDLVSLADINSLSSLTTLNLGIFCHAPPFILVNSVGGVCDVTIPHLLECSSNAFL